MFIKPHIAIHVNTEKEAQDLCALLHSLGYAWCSGMSLIKKVNWDAYRNQTCYLLETHKSVSYFRKTSGTYMRMDSIYEYTDFMNKYFPDEKALPFKYRSGKEMRN